MAEGNNFTSIKDGSDADCEFVCTPCGEDNIREEAVKYCPECQEYLCATCTRHHGRQRATRSHKLHDTDAIKQGSVATMTTKCRYHPDRDIEMYCGTHDMVYCTKCIATEHRSCCEVNNIEDVPKACLQDNEIQKLNDETQTVQEHLKDVDGIRKKGIETLEERRNDILQQLQDMERGLTEHILKLKGEATKALHQTFEEVKNDLESDVTMVTGLLTEIEISKSKLQTITNVDRGQKFVQTKLMQKSVIDAKQLYEECKSKETKTLSFTENTDFRTSVTSVTSLGALVVNKGNTAGQYKLKAKKDINVKMQNDSARCFVSDVCQLQDGTIIIADRFNCKLKRLDKNFNTKDHIDLDDCPLAICCTGPNEIAVKMKKKIQFIFVGTVFSKLRDISIDVCEFYGMAYCDGKLWVSNGSGVIVYSTTGKILDSIYKDVHGKEIFKLATQHITSSEETVIVTDGGDGAVCLGKDAAVRCELRDQMLNITTGACVANGGTVFLSGNESHNIVMFNREGKCLGELVGKEFGLTNPLSLCYDSKRNWIILTRAEYCDFINILEMSN